jgi:NAD(P)H dehydrogenase (quinone)
MTQAGFTRRLIVGAGGSHGATGNHVARQLLARALHVRALVRQVDERADEPRELGAETAVDDIRDYEVVRAAPKARRSS